MAVGGNTLSEGTTSSGGQHGTVRLHQLLYMIMSQEDNSNRITRQPGKQGVRPPAGNQAGVEKLATGQLPSSKRSRSSSEGSTDLARKRSHAWPRFLVISGNDDEFTHLLPSKFRRLCLRRWARLRIPDVWVLVQCWSTLLR